MSIALSNDPFGMEFIPGMKARNKNGCGKECIQFNDGGAL